MPAALRPPSSQAAPVSDEPPAFPSEAGPTQPIKLPGQTRVTPEEYKEFLSLGHGEIFNLDIDRVVDAPWRLPGIDISDFFNYGMNHRAWKEYCQQIQQYREEFSMQNRIQTLDQTRTGDRKSEQRQPEAPARRGPNGLPSPNDDASYANTTTSERATVRRN
ncbi:hypothetical protein QBZ16_004442 [Prototheca wickerhamii]|uniref:Pre-mRNA polyadenylation factor Fip1 domain-containing protein n=1 Tax=Prototheca wickerhamii TaxID=3111 RepID=A0AAD9MHZ7_PROWI|nr:hypothetical protein QBZ16_004442 [Prototheca wickerhamii]